MKRWICLLLAALLLLTPAMALEQPTDEELKISAPSAILMERSTGTVLYEKNADEHLSPASVTKIMTLLLVNAMVGAARSHSAGPAPELLAVALVLLLQWFGRQALLSILLGTGAYVLMRNFGGLPF